MDADNNKQPEQRRNKESNPEIHDRFGHDATLCDTSEPRSGSTAPSSVLETVLSGRRYGRRLPLSFLVLPLPFRSGDNATCLPTLTPSRYSDPDRIVRNTIRSRGAQQVSKMSVSTRIRQRHRSHGCGMGQTPECRLPSATSGVGANHMQALASTFQAKISLKKSCMAIHERRSACLL